MKIISWRSSYRVSLSYSLLTFCLALPLSVKPAIAELAQSPLEITSYVTPNVMLLMDDSGSMDNIIWADAYDPGTTYDDWSASWSSTSGNVYIDDLDECYGQNTWDDSGDYVEGWRNGTRKCLRLPSPRGGDTRYSGNYLNYLFQTYANNTNLRNGQIPNDYRMNVARDVATDLVDDTDDMRFCLADFNYNGVDNNGNEVDGGGQISAACGTSKSTLTTTIDDLDASTWTPLSETFYEVTRYFRGIAGEYSHTGSAYTSPIQYRCQQNFVLALTDGYPTYDWPRNRETRSSHGLSGSERLPDWDGLHPATTQDDFRDNTIPPFSDGFHPDGETSNEGGTLYLDDLAKFGYDIDLKTTGNDLAGKSYEDPAFDQQNLKTYTIGFAVDNQMLEDAAHYGTGTYYTANNAAQLSAALQAAIASIFDRIGSAAASTATTAFLSAGDKVYQSKYDSGDWSGILLAHEIDDNPASPTFGHLKTPPVWNAADELPTHGNRNILTVKSDEYRGNSSYVPVPFTWADLTVEQKAWLDDDEDILDYIRGDQSNEEQNGGLLRDRSTLLGDFVHANPSYVANQDFGYPDANYATFLTDNAGRTPMIYAGANAGIFHGFDATSGEEKFAYVPREVYTQLPNLADPGYQHRYFIDGQPTVIDAKFSQNGNWQTVLVSPLGAGGKAIFALNIRNPAWFNNLDTNKNTIFKWEINDQYPTNNNGNPRYRDLGYVLGQTSVVRTRYDNGTAERWSVITGNGVYSERGRAVVYVVNLANGKRRQQIVLDDGSSYPAPKDENGNGVTTTTVVDLDGDTFADRIYIGDIKGNIWRLDWDPEDGKFEKPFGDNPLFTATVSGTGELQPITAAIEVGTRTDRPGELMLFFGTGKYYETSDNIPGPNFPTQTFYGLWDDNIQHSLTKDNLQAQVITNDTHHGRNIRNVTQNEVDWTSKRGWYTELPDNGERVIYEPLLLKGRILFVTLIPNPNDGSDPCLSGAEGWLMELEAMTGARPSTIIFDVNGDGSFTTADQKNGQNVAGLKPTSGAPLPPSIVRVEPGGGEDGELAKFSSTTEGDIERFTNPAPVLRKSWRRVNTY